MGKICNNCGKELSRRAKFCGQCGSSDLIDINKNNIDNNNTNKNNKSLFDQRGIFAIVVLILMISIGIFFGLFKEKGNSKIDYLTQKDNNVSSEENLSNKNATDIINAGIQAIHQGEYSRAVELYQKACDNSDARGCGLLAIMYDIGMGEVHQDHVKAKELFSKACNLGHQKSCEKVATINSSEGTQQDNTGLDNNYDVGTNRFKDAAYKLITGNKLSNSNDVVEKINSKNIRIYCLSDSNVCKTEEEVAKYLNVPTGGGISKVFGKWTNLKEGDCNDDSDKYIFAIYKHNNLIRYEGYDDDGVITAYKELSNGDIVLEASIESEGYYFNRYIKLSKVGKTLLITWDPEEDKESYTYVYCGNVE